MAQIDIIKTYEKMRSLVIEDFANFRGSIKKMLQNFGCNEVDTAVNGEDAIRQCYKNDYDIILSDYNLGSGKNGQQVLEQLLHDKQIKNTTIYIMVTAEVTQSRVMSALEYQPDAYLTKPFTQKVLQKRLDQTMLQKKALFDINNAIDTDNIVKAIELCDKMILSKSKYTPWCMRTKANLLYENEEYDRAEKIYRSAMEAKNLEWARLGLGKIELCRKNFEEADELFGGLIKDNPYNLDAYDWLSISQEKQSELEQAQNILEKALEVSPNAIKRQSKLGQICRKTGDAETGLAAFEKAAELGQHSIYDSVDNHLNIVRCATELTQKDDCSNKGKLFDIAEKALAKVQKRFTGDSTAQLQAKFTTVGLLNAQGKESMAKAVASEAAEDYLTMEKDATISLSSDISLDFARTLAAMGNHDHASDVLTALKDKYPNDPAIHSEVDILMQNPAIKECSKQVVRLNKLGIQYYEDEQYLKAVNDFREALKKAPRHIGLNLNLVQAILELVKKAGDDDKFHHECLACLKRVRHISKEHAQYARYQSLKSKVQMHNSH